jgi:hypothetical protein
MVQRQQNQVLLAGGVIQQHVFHLAGHLLDLGQAPGFPQNPLDAGEFCPVLPMLGHQSGDNCKH